MTWSLLVTRWCQGSASLAKGQHKFNFCEFMVFLINTTGNWAKGSEKVLKISFLFLWPKVLVSSNESVPQGDVFCS